MSTKHGEASIQVIYDGVDISGLVESATLNGDVAQAARTLSVNLINTSDGRKKLVNIANGKEITLSNHGELLFRGVVFMHDINEKGRHNITSHDEAVYLTKNVGTYRFVRMTASAIFKRLCNDAGVPVGQVDDTGYVIPKMIVRDQSLYDIAIMALTMTRKQNGKKFVIRANNGKISLLERKKQTSKWVLENGVNILGATYSQSIEEAKTRVKVVGNNTSDDSKEAVLADVTDSKTEGLFGKMTHVEHVDKDVKKAEAQQLARELLKQLATIDDEANVTCLGINDVVAGSAIYAKEQMTGIIGGYYVITDSHTFQGGLHTMDLKLSATDELPKLEYEGGDE